MDATSFSGVLPQMKLSHSDHKLSIGRSCSSSRSLGFDSCHSSKRLRLPKQLTVSCSTPSDKGNMFGVSHSCKKSPVGETYCPAGVYTYAGTVESHSHTAEEKVGVLLLNLGGPETLHDVQPFLFNLFADPANELKKALKSKDLPVNVYVGMRYWYPFTEEAVQQCPRVPESYVKDAGDPYKDQMEECIFLIMKELKSRGINNEHTLAYQSRVGPVQWLKPYTDEVLVELGQKGVKSLLAVPVRGY
ncbi:hypothetical protein GBA52_028673 [Prunus armeniaca]|nr:hypothetical protein GBA52_028673 [Prunus armeniaca]